MNIQVFKDAEAVASHAADVIAQEAQDAVRDRGKFLLAVSGGTTPWRMLELLSRKDLPWQRFHIFQVDERVAEDTSSARNYTHLRESLLDRVPIPAEQVQAMPVGMTSLAAAAAEYGKTLRRIAGTPPCLDLVHLGLGADGHTASLVPGDPVLDVRESDVAITGEYQGFQRMTLTFPAFAQARLVLWVVTGSDKAPALARLRAGDLSIPAGRVVAANALLLADLAAAG